MVRAARSVSPGRCGRRRRRSSASRRADSSAAGRSAGCCTTRMPFAAAAGRGLDQQRKADAARPRPASRRRPGWPGSRAPRARRPRCMAARRRGLRAHDAHGGRRWGRQRSARRPPRHRQSRRSPRESRSPDGSRRSPVERRLRGCGRRAGTIRAAAAGPIGTASSASATCRRRRRRPNRRRRWRCPVSWQARMMRTAISPRLAIRIFRNMVQVNTRNETIRYGQQRRRKRSSSSQVTLAGWPLQPIIPRATRFPHTAVNFVAAYRKTSRGAPVFCSWFSLRQTTCSGAARRNIDMALICVPKRQFSSANVFPSFPCISATPPEKSQPPDPLPLGDRGCPLRRMPRTFGRLVGLSTFQQPLLRLRLFLLQIK